MDAKLKNELIHDYMTDMFETVNELIGSGIDKHAIARDYLMLVYVFDSDEEFARNCLGKTFADTIDAINALYDRHSEKMSDDEFNFCTASIYEDVLDYLDICRGVRVKDLEQFKRILRGI